MSEYIVGAEASEFLRGLEDDSVDLLLTDPPYYGVVEDAWDNCWANERAFATWLSDLLLLALPKLTPTGSLVFFGALGKHGSHPLFRVVTALEDGGYCFRNWVTWKKRRAYGKQIALTTEIPTPDGFVPLVDLKVGDTIFDEQGEPCKVLKLHPVDLAPVSYRVTFDDGSVVDACQDHLWWTQDRQERRTRKPPGIRTTEDIYRTLRHGQESNHSVPTCGPVAYVTKAHPVDPYLLGLWLGDGSADTGAITTADPEVLLGVDHYEIPSGANKGSKARLYRCRGLTTQLRKMGVLKNKHIPFAYLHGDRGQRLSLLQGLMDSDGTCGTTGQVEFCNMNENLARQVHALMLSLGMKATCTQGDATIAGVVKGTKFRVGCVTGLPIFRLPRKMDRVTANIGKPQITKRTNRYIADVRPIPPVAMRCLTVDSPNGLFLITRNFIPTHNSHDYLYTREEILWFSRSAERTGIRFNKPYTDEVRGYEGFDPRYKALSKFKRVANVFNDIDDPGTVVDTVTEIFNPQRSCQKPRKLIERFILAHSEPGDLIVDPFSGWGTTGVEAVRLGRRFRGCEGIPEDARAANERVLEEVRASEDEGVLGLFES